MKEYRNMIEEMKDIPIDESADSSLSYEETEIEFGKKDYSTEFVRLQEENRILKKKLRFAEKKLRSYSRKNDQSNRQSLSPGFDIKKLSHPFSSNKIRLKIRLDKRLTEPKISSKRSKRDSHIYQRNQNSPFLKNKKNSIICLKQQEGQNTKKFKRFRSPLLKKKKNPVYNSYFQAKKSLNLTVGASGNQLFKKRKSTRIKDKENGNIYDRLLAKLRKLNEKKRHIQGNTAKKRGKRLNTSKIPSKI